MKRCRAKRLLVRSAGLAAGVGLSWAAAAAAAEPVHAVLPPEPGWSGASEALIAAHDDPWITPSERSGLTTTPRYDETIAWLERLAEAAPEVKLVPLGTSSEKRLLWMAVVSKEGAETPDALASNGRPTLLAQAGIHAGEIDGKDAGLMLLRDLTVAGTKKEILERANLLFVPIFNVDGHERFSEFSRINQRGPFESGWRTTAVNLNLNRDYSKLDAPEMRAMIAAIDAWSPDLYLDLHVTDGGDYQADITFGWNRRTPFSPSIERWLEKRFRPAEDRDLAAAGHVAGPLTLFAGDRAEEGIYDFTADPRFSTGYGDLRHLPTVLVENHSLKSYRRRVLGTYVFLESALRTLCENGTELRRAIEEDRARRIDPVPIAWAPTPGPPPTIPFAGIEGRLRDSEISGSKVVDWTARPVATEVPLIRNDVPGVGVKRPRAYWLSPVHSGVLARLSAHGIELHTLTTPESHEVEVYRLSDVKLESEPFEGRVRVSAATTSERRTEELPAGWVKVSTDQPLGDLAIALLEPGAPDSFFQWGFFLGCLQQTEYVDPYVMEPTARKMLEADPLLRAEFEAKLATDAAFAADPAARLDFFYRRSPYFDESYLVYPVFREP